MSFSDEADTMAMEAVRDAGVRTMREFAEDEIVLPSGPRANMRFRVSYQPFTGLVLDAFDDPRWRRHFGTGNVQGSKTLTFMIIPAAYHLFEMKESVGLGAPKIELGQSIYKQRIEPALRRTRYANLLPVSGKGSRGGMAESIEFKNGATLRFMGAGGGDAQRASHTMRVMILTEIDKMDVAGTISREADPVTQMEARTAAFSDAARIYGECTVSIESGRVWKEIQGGTDSRIVLLCPLCNTFIYPERAHLVGWREAPTVVAARALASYTCQSCSGSWDEGARALALAAPRILHSGQEVVGDQIEGEPKESVTFGVKWNAVHSAMVSMADIAEREWRAEHSQSEELEKALRQFTWVIPWREESKGADVTFRLLAQHTSTEYLCDPEKRDEPLPGGVDFTIMSVDVQKRWLYWLVDGYARDGLTRWTLAYGITEIVPQMSQWDAHERDIRGALDETMGHARRYNCASTWVDTGYRHEGALTHVIRDWCGTAGNGVHAIVGRSESQMKRMNVAGKKLELPEGVGDMVQARRLEEDGSVLWFIDVDRVKDEIYFRLFRERGTDGSATGTGYHFFPLDAANKDRTDRNRTKGSVGWIFEHFMRSKREVTYHGAREVRIWKEHGRYDLWDCAAYSFAGAMVTLADIEESDSGAPVAQGAQSKSTIHLKY